MDLLPNRETANRLPSDEQLIPETMEVRSKLFLLMESCCWIEYEYLICIIIDVLLLLGYCYNRNCNIIHNSNDSDDGCEYEEQSSRSCSFRIFQQNSVNHEHNFKITQKQILNSSRQLSNKLWNDQHELRQQLQEKTFTSAYIHMSFQELLTVEREEIQQQKTRIINGHRKNTFGNNRIAPYNIINNEESRRQKAVQTLSSLLERKKQISEGGRSASAFNKLLLRKKQIAPRSNQFYYRRISNEEKLDRLRQLLSCNADEHNNRSTTVNLIKTGENNVKYSNCNDFSSPKATSSLIHLNSNMKRRFIPASLSKEPFTYTKDYFQLADEYKQSERYRVVGNNSSSTSSFSICLFCKARPASLVYFPCEHRCSCLTCLRQQNPSTKQYHPNNKTCPVCGSIVKLTLKDNVSGNDDNSNAQNREKYWRWVNQVKPFIDGEFIKSFLKKSSKETIEETHNAPSHTIDDKCFDSISCSSYSSSTEGPPNRCNLCSIS